MIADSAGRAVAFSLAPGQAHELPHAIPLLARLPGISQIDDDLPYGKQEILIELTPRGLAVREVRTWTPVRWRS